MVRRLFHTEGVVVNKWFYQEHITVITSFFTRGTWGLVVFASDEYLGVNLFATFVVIMPRVAEWPWVTGHSTDRTSHNGA